MNNTNFFAVRVSNLSVQVLFLPTIDRTPHEVGNIQLYSTEHIGLRENKKVDVNTVNFCFNFYSARRLQL